MKKLAILSLSLFSILLTTQLSFGFDPGERVIDLEEEITDVDLIREKLQALNLSSSISFSEGENGVATQINPQSLNLDLVNDLLEKAIENKNLFAAAVLVKLGADIEIIKNEEYREIVEQAVSPQIKGAGKQ